MKDEDITEKRAEVPGRCNCGSWVAVGDLIRHWMPDKMFVRAEIVGCSACNFTGKRR